MEFECYRQLVWGDSCQLLLTQAGVQEKRSRFGGRTAHVTRDFLYANGNGDMHAVRRGTWINAERSATKERADDQDHRTPVPYTTEQLAEIDAAYEAETRRGADTRYFEDAEVSDQIQPRADGT